LPLTPVHFSKFTPFIFVFANDLPYHQHDGQSSALQYSLLLSLPCFDAVDWVGDWSSSKVCSSLLSYPGASLLFIVNLLYLQQYTMLFSMLSIDWS